jgi:hypothetical protein
MVMALAVVDNNQKSRLFTVAESGDGRTVSLPA